MRQIYRVIFGKSEGIYGDDATFDKELSFNNGDATISVPVYAYFDGEVIRELVTGMESPRIINSHVPGFGAYQLELVYTSAGYTNIVYYLNLCKSSIESYKEALERVKRWGDKRREEYEATHSDSYGIMSEDEEGRKFREKDKIKRLGTKIEAYILSNSNR